MTKSFTVLDQSFRSFIILHLEDTWTIDPIRLSSNALRTERNWLTIQVNDNPDTAMNRNGGWTGRLYLESASCTTADAADSAC